MVEITWLGHGTFQFKLESGEVILVDPWTTGNPKYPAGHKFERLDTVLITHGHSDHIGDAVETCKKFKPQVVANFEIIQWLGSKGVENTISMNKGGKVTVGPISATMTHAVHSSGISDGDQILYGGEAGGFIIQFPDNRKAYFAGDTAIFAEMEIYGSMHELDLAFLPIGDHYTMGPSEAAQAAKLLRVKEVIPMHYGTFPVLVGRPDELAASLTGTGMRVHALEPGKPFQW